MKSTVLEVVSGAFVLIGIFLFVNNFKGTVAIINALFGKSIEGVRALQGKG